MRPTKRTQLQLTHLVTVLLVSISGWVLLTHFILPEAMKLSGTWGEQSCSSSGTT
jgi:hypothetical protein